MKAYKNTLPASKNNKSCLNCFSPATFIRNYVVTSRFCFARPLQIRRFLSKLIRSGACFPDYIYQGYL